MYAYSVRPMVIRNATLDWPAMEKLNFPWLKEAYLSDPEILDYKDEKECWYSNYKSLHQQSSPPGQHHCGQHQRLVSQHQDRGA